MTHYTTLNLPPTATAAQIKAAYRKIVLKTHPDKTVNETAAEKKRLEELCKAANEAWDILGDEKKKAEYDLALRMGRVPTSAAGFGSTGPGGGGGFARPPPAAGSTRKKPEESSKAGGRSFPEDTFDDEDFTGPYGGAHAHAGASSGNAGWNYGFGYRHPHGAPPFYGYARPEGTGNNNTFPGAKPQQSYQQNASGLYGQGQGQAAYGQSAYAGYAYQQPHQGPLKPPRQQQPRNPYAQPNPPPPFNPYWQANPRPQRNYPVPQKISADGFTAMWERSGKYVISYWDKTLDNSWSFTIELSKAQFKIHDLPKINVYDSFATVRWSDHRDLVTPTMFNSMDTMAVQVEDTPGYVKVASVKSIIRQVRTAGTAPDDSILALAQPWSGIEIWIQLDENREEADFSTENFLDPLFVAAWNPDYSNGFPALHGAQLKSYWTWNIITAEWLSKEAEYEEFQDCATMSKSLPYQYMLFLRGKTFRKIGDTRSKVGFRYHYGMFGALENSGAL